MRSKVKFKWIYHKWIRHFSFDSDVGDPEGVHTRHFYRPTFHWSCSISHRIVSRFWIWEDAESRYREPQNPVAATSNGVNPKRRQVSRIFTTKAHVTGSLHMTWSQIQVVLETLHISSHATANYEATTRHGNSALIRFVDRIHFHILSITSHKVVSLS